MDRQIITNPDRSWTLMEGDRRLDLPPGASIAEMEAAASAFFTPAPGEET